MKIKTENIKNAKLVVPIDGLIEIDANGIADVSENCAKIMVEKTNSWKYAEAEAETEAEVSEPEAEAETEVDERAEFEKSIRLKKFDELKKFAIESGCDENEVNSITTKKAMVNYLLDKFDSEE
jgi:hypothetical protein